MANCEGVCFGLSDTEFSRPCPFFMDYETKKAVYEKYGWDFRDYEKRHKDYLKSLEKEKEE